jgi:hypothetical protein
MNSMTVISIVAYAGIGVSLTGLGLQMRQKKKRWILPFLGGIVFLIVALLATAGTLLK